VVGESSARFLIPRNSRTTTTLGWSVQPGGVKVAVFSTAPEALQSTVFTLLKAIACGPVACRGRLTISGHLDGLAFIVTLPRRATPFTLTVRLQSL